MFYYVNRWALIYTCIFYLHTSDSLDIIAEKYSKDKIGIEWKVTSKLSKIYLRIDHSQQVEIPAGKQIYVYKLKKNTNNDKNKYKKKLLPIINVRALFKNGSVTDTKRVFIKNNRQNNSNRNGINYYSYYCPPIIESCSFANDSSIFYYPLFDRIQHGHVWDSQYKFRSLPDIIQDSMLRKREYLPTRERLRNIDQVGQIDSTKLTCYVDECSGIVSYEWYQVNKETEGDDILISTSATADIPYYVLDSNRRYIPGLVRRFYCVLKNQYGSIRSQDYMLYNLKPYKFDTTPKEITIEEGDPLRIQCTLPPSYRNPQLDSFVPNFDPIVSMVSKSGTQFMANTSESGRQENIHSYYYRSKDKVVRYISSFKSDMERYYYCEYIEPNGEVRSDFKPQEQNDKNYNVTYVNVLPSKSSSKRNDYSGNRENGKDKGECWKHLEEERRLNNTVTEVDVMEGETIVLECFTCRTSEFTSEFKEFKWTVVNQQSSANKTFAYSLNKQFIDKSQYTNDEQVSTDGDFIRFNVAKESLSGSYSCKRYDKAVNEWYYRSYKVRVKPLPRIENDLKFHGTVGNSIEIICENYPIDLDVKLIYKNKEYGKSFTLNNLSKVDQGQIICEVKNRKGIRYKKYGYLKVYDPIQFVLQPQSKEISEIEKQWLVCFDCVAKVDADLESEIIWDWNGIPLLNFDKIFRKLPNDSLVLNVAELGYNYDVLAKIRLKCTVKTPYQSDSKWVEFNPKITNVPLKSSPIEQNTRTKLKENFNEIIIVIVVTFCALLCIIIMIVVIIRCIGSKSMLKKWKNICRKRDTSHSSSTPCISRKDGTDNLSLTTNFSDIRSTDNRFSCMIEVMPRLDSIDDPDLINEIKSMYIPNDCLKINSKCFGSGNFSCVKEALYDSTLIKESNNLLLKRHNSILSTNRSQSSSSCSVINNYTVVKVAVKSHKCVENCEKCVPNNQHRVPDKCLLKEAVLMKSFHHPNVLHTIGVSFTDDEIPVPLIVMPFMELGDLRCYVSNPNAIFHLEELVLLCRQVASGMDYLSSLNFVHRDLAARNCLIDKSLTVKISDFGLSRLMETDLYRVMTKDNPLPIYSMAPESIFQSEFSTASDVWSFGVVCWEVVTRGRFPWDKISLEYLRYLISQGQRLQIPDYCDETLKRIINSCWKSNPSERPTFKQLIYLLDYVNRPQSIQYNNMVYTANV